MIATMRTKFGPIVIGAIIGLIAFVFIFYGIFRIFVEFFREPDLQIGYIFGWLTEGQILSLLMVGFGMGARLNDLKVGTKVDVLYHIGMNKWNGREEPQGILVDISVQ